MYEIGSIAYIIESNNRVREVKVVKFTSSNNLYTVRFTDTEGAIRLKANRLFSTKEEAEAKINNTKQSYRSKLRFS